MTVTQTPPVGVARGSGRARTGLHTRLRDESSGLSERVRGLHPPHEAPGHPAEPDGNTLLVEGRAQRRAELAIERASECAEGRRRLLPAPCKRPALHLRVHRTGRLEGGQKVVLCDDGGDRGHNLTLAWPSRKN